MLVGHVAVGLVGKRAAPKVSWGVLVLAALLADLLWCVFMMAGIERLEIIQPGTTLMNSAVTFQISYSHSLAIDGLWAGLFGGAYYLVRRDARAAWVLAAAGLSHWLLDFISHNPDMPLAPGVPKFYGLGLWNSIPATLAVEGSLWVAAVILSARAMRYAFWIGVVVLTAAWWNNIAGPPPNPSAMGITSFIFFSLVVGWAYWIDPRSPSPSPPAPRAPAAPAHPIPPEHPRGT